MDLENFSEQTKIQINAAYNYNHVYIFTINYCIIYLKLYLPWTRILPVSSLDSYGQTKAYHIFL